MFQYFRATFQKYLIQMQKDLLKSILFHAVGSTIVKSKNELYQFLMKMINSS